MADRRRDRRSSVVSLLSLSLSLSLCAAAVLAGLALSGGRMASAQAPDQGYWLPAESAVDGGDGFLVPPDSEVGLPILWPPEGGYMPMGGGGGPTVKVIYPRGPEGEYPGLCPLKKPPDNRGILVRSQGTPEGGTYSWSGTPEADGPDAFYTFTTCGLTYAATVTYTLVGQASATSGYLRVFDADLTLEGGSSDPQDTVEDAPGFFMAVGTRKCLTISLSPSDPDDVMPDEGEYEFNEGLNPRGLLPPYQVWVSVSGGSCVDFYDVPQEGTPLGSDDLFWGWKELDPQGHPDEFTEVSVPAQLYVEAETPGTCTVGLGLMFRCPEECGDWLTDGGYTGDNVKLTIVDAKLKAVTFSADPDSPVNYFSVAADTDASTYPAPHWLDANGDGDADDPAQGDQKSPVCFLKNTKMAATVTVSVGPPEYFTGAVKIRGDGPGNLDFPATDANVAGGEATTAEPIKCSNPFPNCVTCYVGPDTALAISWQISRDGGASWIDLPTSSKNEAFITLDTPQCATPFRTVLYLATERGGTSPETCLTNTWAMFGTGTGPKDVKGWNDATNKYDRALYYYHTYTTAACSAAGLLAAGDGQCHAWAELFKECLLANHVQNVMRKRVFPYGGYLGFGVKSIAFDDVGPMYPADAPWSYGISSFDGEGRELDDLDITAAGRAGQNMGTPHKKLFGQHFLVHRTGDSTYYDPSYGIATTGAGAYTPDAVDAWAYLLGGVLHYRKSASAPTVSLVFLPDETW